MDSEEIINPATGGTEFVRWAEISRIVTYKVDRLAFDDIFLDIFWKDWKLTITEDTPGWDQLVSRLRIRFPTIPENWYGTVMKPPFATNYTVLFERDELGEPAETQQ